MPTQPLFELPFSLSLAMLAALYASVLISIAVLSRIVPALSAGMHSNTVWLDGLRGIAAAAVALNHAPLVVFSLLLRPTVFGYSMKELILFGFFGSIGVQFFFCITGMLFANKILFSERIDWTEFFRYRLLRIVPAYFAACALALAIAAWISWPVKQPLRDIFIALPNLLSFGLLTLPKINGFDFVRLLGINWTLAVEWRYYVMLPIVFIFFRKLRWFLVIGVIIYAGCDAYWNGRAAWACLVSGSLCAPLLHRQFGPRMRGAAYAGILIAVTVYAKYWQTLSFYGFEHWLLMTLLFGSLTIARPRLLTSRPFVAMGSISYSFYLLHSMVLVAIYYACHVYWFDVTGLTVCAYTVLACITLLLATLLSMVAYLYIERPFMRVRANGLHLRKSD